MLEIEVQAQSAAAATTVWAILTDATTWTAWSPVDRAKVESGHELGEVRRFRVPLVAGLSWPRLTSRERTTIYELPRRWGYEMLSGVPGSRITQPRSTSSQCRQAAPTSAGVCRYARR